MSARVFELVRHVDMTGLSGTGVIAEGVMFSDGTVANRWLRYPSTTIWPSLESLLAVHGHGGATEARFLDEPEPLPTTTPGAAWESHDDPEIS